MKTSSGLILGASLIALASSACDKKSLPSSTTTATQPAATQPAQVSTVDLGQTMDLSLYLDTSASGSTALTDPASTFDPAKPVSVTVSTLPADPASPPVQIGSVTATPDPTTGLVTATLPTSGIQATDAALVVTTTQGAVTASTPVAPPDLTVAKPAAAAPVSANTDKAAKMYLAARGVAAKDPASAPPSLDISDVLVAAAAYSGVADNDALAASFVQSEKAAFDSFVSNGGTTETYKATVADKSHKAADPAAQAAAIAACSCTPGSLDQMRRVNDQASTAAAAAAPAGAAAAAASAISPLTAMMQHNPDPDSLKRMGAAMLATQLDANPNLTDSQKQTAMKAGTAAFYAAVDSDPKTAGAAAAQPMGSQANPFTSVVSAAQVTANQNLGIDPAAVLGDASVQKSLADVTAGTSTLAAGMDALKAHIVAAVSAQTAALVAAGKITPAQAAAAISSAVNQASLLAHTAADPENKGVPPATIASNAATGSLGAETARVLADPKAQAEFSAAPSAPNAVAAAAGSVPLPPPAPLNCSTGQLPIPVLASGVPTGKVECGTLDDLLATGAAKLVPPPPKAPTAPAASPAPAAAPAADIRPVPSSAPETAPPTSAPSSNVGGTGPSAPSTSAPSGGIMPGQEPPTHCDAPKVPKSTTLNGMTYHYCG